MKRSKLVLICVALAVLSPAYGAPPTASDVPEINLVNPPAGWTPPRATTSHAVTADDYPSASVLAGEEGRTQLKYMVGTDGAVSDIVVLQSSGSARLDEAAQAIVKRWRFNPAMHDGKPAPVWVKAMVVWKLHDYFEMGEGVPGMPMAFVDPELRDYPLESIAAHEEGSTVIMVVVTKDATVGTVAVMRPSGHPRLDQAALSLVLGRWHPTPATLAGKPVQTVLMLVVRWKRDPH